MRIFIFILLLFQAFIVVGQPKKPAHLPFCWTLDKMATKLDTTRSRGLIDNYQLWDVGQSISVAFVGRSSKKLQDLVLEYAKTWEQYANIKFVRATGNEAHVRVSLGDEANYTYIGSVANSISQDEPTMWIDTFYTSEPKKFRAAVLHEFGHVLGLMHEHKHPLSNIKWNKEKIYSSIPYCVWGGDNTELDYWTEFLTQAHSFYTNGTAYDNRSIMHYAIPATITLDGYSTPWNYELSDGDKQIISRFYPKQGRSQADEVFRVNAKVKKIQVQEKVGQGYLIRADVDIQPKKDGEIYFVVLFYDSLGYAIEDNDEKYNVQGTVAIFEKLQLDSGRAVAGSIDMVLPYDQLKLPNDNRNLQARAVIYHYSTQLDEVLWMYQSDPMNVKVPVVKIRPVSTSISKAPKQSVSRTLSIPEVQQKTPVWCWLAVGEMLFRYYGVRAVNNYDYQCGIIGLIYQPCFTDCTNPRCIIPSGSNFGTLNMIRQYPRLASSRNVNYLEGKELSLQSVINNINAGKPIVCGISPTSMIYNRDSEHAVMITGYDIGQNGYYLLINDPYPYTQGQNPYVNRGGRVLSANKYMISYQNFTVNMCWNWSLSNISM